MSKIEATVAVCKCGESKKMYGVRFQKMQEGNWKYTWAFPMRSTTAKREGYDNTIIEGMIEPDMDYPGCPYCGTKYFVICSCGKLNCNIGYGDRFTCGWCHTTGTLMAYGGGGIQSGGDR